MHGLGNDFVVIEAQLLARPLDAMDIRRLGDRHAGIGFDQLLLLDTASLRYRVFNADGGEVEQCGNGARCLARYAVERGHAGGAELQLISAAGPIAARVEDGAVSINLGVPRFAPAQIPFAADREALTYELDVDGEKISLGALSVGNPHAILAVDSAAAAPVVRLGPLIERHPRFPERVNVGFLEIVDAGRCRLRVFERGVGETRACGTGAAAAVVWGHRAGKLGERATVELAGGELEVAWGGAGTPVWLTGPAEFTFEGQIQL
jgi:diaminopimelate epimerase